MSYEKMAKTRDIQRRIKSVTNTKKITRAMEMVAAAKMRKAVDSVLRTRSYANLSWSTVLNLAKTLSENGQCDHPLFENKKKKEARTGKEKVAIILFSSNRGLCGAFNSSIIGKAHRSVVRHHQEASADFILVGKKGEAIHKHHGYNVSAQFEKSDVASEVMEVVPIAKMIVGDYLAGKYDKILVAYTDFISAAKQIPRVKQILPIDVAAEEKYLGIVGEDTRIGTTKDFIAGKEEKYLSDEGMVYEYTFEPDPRTVLDEIVPRLVEIQLFQALLESNASEHSARMAAMHQATEAATTMIGELTLFYNKARQAAITAEIAEISAGADALK